MSERSDLMDEATDLGLDFAKNIKTTKLVEMVAEAKGEPIPVQEVVPAGPAVKAEDPGADLEAITDVRKLAQVRAAIKRKKISDAKAKAMKTQVVTITNKDNRENDIMTTVYLSFENQHFGISKLVPLDIPVQVESALIDIAEKTTMTLHKAEIREGRHTGNKIPVTVKKFAISYAKQ